MTEKLNIYQRVLAVMAEVDYIQKGAKTVNGQYRFVGHDLVTAKLHPQFVKHGIACIPSVKQCKQDGNRTEVILTVKFVNVDNLCDFIESDFVGYGIDPQDKGPGKAISYAYKYAILKTFCLETGDDPDEDQKTEHKPQAIIEAELRSKEEQKKCLISSKDLEEEILLGYSDEEKTGYSGYLKDAKVKMKIKHGDEWACAWLALLQNYQTTPKNFLKHYNLWVDANNALAQNNVQA